MKNAGMRVLNFGSLNIDLVYRAPHIVTQGETLPICSMATFAGGKGANQSVALARAGASVSHAGKVGEDGRWLIEKLASYGVDTQFVRVGGERTGCAIIQVDDAGQNAILLFAGANKQIQRDVIDETLRCFGPADALLLQNEINDIAYLMAAGHARGMKVCLNLAPFSQEALSYPLDCLDILIVNETEGAGLSGAREPNAILDALSGRASQCEIVLTLGAQGAMLQSGARRIHALPPEVKAVDTTAAGDTFIGYFLAERLRGHSAEASLSIACAAAALSVTRLGAMDSIPSRAEVESFQYAFQRGTQLAE